MKFNNITKITSPIIRATKTISEMMPSYFLVITLRAIVCATMPYISLYLSGKIVDLLYIKSSFQQIVLYIILLVVSNFTLEIINQFLWNKLRINHIIFDSWEELYLNKKSFNMDYIQIEQPYTRSLRNSIVSNREEGGIKKLILIFMTVLNEFFSCVTATLMLWRLLTSYATSKIPFISFVNSNYGTTLMFLLTVSTLIAVAYTTKKGIQDRQSSSKEFAKIQEQSNYYIDEYIDDLAIAKDIRLYSQQNIIKKTIESMINKYSIIVKNIQNANRSYNSKSEIYRLLLSATFYIYIGIKAISGAIGIGSIIEFSGVIKRFIKSIANLTIGLFELINNNKYIEDFFKYVDLPTNANTETNTHNNYIPKETELKIEFKNVWFKYPGAKDFALKNINLSLNSDDKVAVVGINGSGKTTLIKLLCRFYKPTKGEILINGVNIEEISKELYNSLFSVVFQDYKIFSLSIANNVSASITYDENFLWKSLQKAGIKERVENMESGILTMINKDIDDSGVMLSGGESQKIAIARAFYKNSKICIFDEPSAALDPISEYETYNMINQETDGKLTIFISHRLSSCRFCKKIIVMNEGEIKQTGTHSELLSETCGLYLKLWEAQAKHYQERCSSDYYE